MPVKHCKAAVARAQAKHPTPGMADHAGGFVHHLLQHRADAPALGRVAHGRIGLVQGVLSNQAQQATSAANGIASTFCAVSCLT